MQMAFSMYGKSKFMHALLTSLIWSTRSKFEARKTKWPLELSKSLHNWETSDLKTECRATEYISLVMNGTIHPH